MKCRLCSTKWAMPCTVCIYFNIFQRMSLSCLIVYFNSHDRTNRLPKRIRNALCDRFRRTTLDPNGALSQLTLHPVLIRPQRQYRRRADAPVRQPPRRPMPLHRHLHPNHNFLAGPNVPLKRRIQPHIRHVGYSCSLTGHKRHHTLRAGNVLANSVRTPIWIRRDILFVFIR